MLSIDFHSILDEDTGTDTVTDLVNEGHEGNMLQDALLPSYVLCGAQS